jgi:hypothetical protein
MLQYFVTPTVIPVHQLPTNPSLLPLLRTHTRTSDVISDAAMPQDPAAAWDAENRGEICRMKPREFRHGTCEIENEIASITNKLLCNNFRRRRLMAPLTRAHAQAFWEFGTPRAPPTTVNVSILTQISYQPRWPSA